MSTLSKEKRAFRQSCDRAIHGAASEWYSVNDFGPISNTLPSHERNPSSGESICGLNARPRPTGRPRCNIETILKCRRFHRNRPTERVDSLALDVRRFRGVDAATSQTRLDLMPSESHPNWPARLSPQTEVIFGAAPLPPQPASHDNDDQPADAPEEQHAGRPECRATCVAQDERAEKK